MLTQSYEYENVTKSAWYSFLSHLNSKTVWNEDFFIKRVYFWVSSGGYMITFWRICSSCFYWLVLSANLCHVEKSSFLRWRGTLIFSLFAEMCKTKPWLWTYYMIIAVNIANNHLFLHFFSVYVIRHSLWIQCAYVPFYMNTNVHVFKPTNKSSIPSEKESKSSKWVFLLLGIAV